MTERVETEKMPQDQYRCLLLKLPGIYAANVLMEDENTVREVHVVAASSRNPKQISRDIQSALLAAFDLKLDHRVISIAQLSANPFEDEVETGPTGAGVRLQCAGVSTRVEDGHYHVSVLLRYGERGIQGEAVCRNTPAQRMRAVVQATLDAAHAFLGTEELFTIVATQSATVSGTAIAITLLEYSYAKEERLLIGAARQGEDAATGFVRSTLDAMNRSLAMAAGRK